MEKRNIRYYTTLNCSMSQFCECIECREMDGVIQ